MIIATTLRYLDLGKGEGWDHRYSIIDFYKTMAERCGVGLVSVMTDGDIERVAELCDGLIIPGSPTNIDPSYYGEPSFDPPEPADEYALDAKMIGLFLKKNKPIFGVCGGHQAINVYFGGTLKRVDGGDSHNLVTGERHKIKIKEGSFVYDVFEQTEAFVNSYHYWEIGRLAPSLEAVAWSEDGVIEAVECREKKVFATQWHPERSFAEGDPIENKFFEHFLKLCER